MRHFGVQARDAIQSREACVHREKSLVVACRAGAIDTLRSLLLDSGLPNPSSRKVRRKMDTFLKWAMYIIQFISAIGLIALVVSQTDRSEGLGAVGGSSSAPAQRGRAGMDEKLNEYTKYVAFAFLALSLLLYILNLKYHWG